MIERTTDADGLERTADQMTTTRAGAPTTRSSTGPLAARPSTRCLAALAALGALTLAACEDSASIGVQPDPPDAGCARVEEPRHYEIFFVLDVSGSMVPFLSTVRAELQSLAAGFPTEDALGRGVRVDYYVVGFVNDSKVFGGGRMSSTLALQGALDDAIAAGASEKNLTQDSSNIEPEENLLDALAQVATLAEDSASTKVVLVATDAPFVESPSQLNQGLRVQATYGAVRADLERLQARVHVFTGQYIPGLTQPWNGAPPLSTLPGSGAYRLDELQGARQRVAERLNIIARSAVCG
jgi:hypothetical protein